jgi:protocatechuate 3,4-dioxygenase beta subunit
MKVQRYTPWTIALMFVCLVHVNGLGTTLVTSPDPLQGQLVSVGVLPFQDESGTSPPLELGQKLAQDLQQRLAVSYKDLLPRVLSTGAGADASAVKTMSVEQIVAFGKQNGVKFVVRGGVLALVLDNAGTDTKISAQLYAEIISVEAASIVNTVRAEGAGAQADKLAALSAIDVKSDQFGTSALGQALMAAIGQLTENIHQAVTTSATASQTISETGQTAAQPDAAQAEAAKAADADSELQQLIAQAESLLSSGANAGTETISAVQQSLEALKTALASKASLLEQGQDTTQADQQITQHKEELQAALAKLAEEAATNASTSTGGEQSSGEKKGFMTSINEFAGEALGFLQKIQEMRAALQGFKQEQSASGEMGNEGAMPSEEQTEDVNGVVTEDGAPVADATVTDQESGLSTKTDSNGSYTLKGLTSGKLAKLLVTKGQKTMSAQVDVFHGRSNVADFQLKSMSASAGTISASRILPSTVIASAASTRAGAVKGVVLDATGRPVPRALVSLKGLAVARTNSQGQYAFLNVPEGAHQLSISQSGLKTKSAQLKVTAKNSSEANIKFGAGDKLASLSTKGSLIQPGASTTLRGTVLDTANRPISAAKVSVIQSNAVVSVFSGRDGSFELRNLKPAEYRLAVYKVGFESANQSLALRSGGVERREFKLKPQVSPLIASVLKNQSAQQKKIDIARQGQTSGQVRNTTTGSILVTKGQLAGRITDAADRKPISGVTVSLPGMSSIKTDQQGNYAIGNLAAGTYQLSVKLSGYTSETRAVTVRSGSLTQQDVTLRSERREQREITTGIIRPSNTVGRVEVRKGQLTGQVIDAKTGKPITGATVSLTGQRGGVLTDQAGRFAISNLSQGAYQITVSRIGFAQGQGSVVVRASETVTANFKLNPITRSQIRLP